MCRAGPAPGPPDAPGPPVLHVDVKPSALGLKKELKREDGEDPLAKRELEEQEEEQEVLEEVEELMEEEVEDSDDVLSISSTSSSPACCPESSCSYTTSSLSSLQVPYHMVGHRVYVLLWCSIIWY